MLRLVFAAAAAAAAAPRALRGRYVTVAVGGKDCNITAYGAAGDGVTNDTAAIQAALDDCGSGGGRVLVPAGRRFLTSAVRFTGGSTELHIEAGATLLVSDDMQRWPTGRHVISARGLSHIAITGGGTVDGQGEVWWRAEEKDKGVFRPHMVDFSHVSHAILSDTLYLNGPNHVLELGADDCEVAAVSVLAPPSTGGGAVHSHNTDAVDVHGTPFYIHNVNFTTGDDNVAVHANHTLVEDSYFGTGHGASIGSLCGDYLHNITFRNITFRGTTAGCRVKSHSKCGGHVWGVLFEGLDMAGVQQTIEVNQFYEAHPSDPSSYLFENFTFRNITSVPFGATDKTLVDFNCGTHFDGASNCKGFRLDGVRFTGAAQMRCHGVEGTAAGLSGIDSCLPASSPPPGCDVHDCFTRCAQRYGSTDGVYMCSKGCAGMRNGKVDDAAKFCRFPGADRAAECTAGCSHASSDAGKRAMCDYGCGYWRS